MTPAEVRVRFAPSPTGPLHIGGLRTALYNYLFAKKHNGTFILRIEDTDQKRFVPKAEAYILEALEWLGITPDESPQNPNPDMGYYRQSQRNDIYSKYIEKLLKEDKAYYAFDTAEDLDAVREQFQSQKKVFAYNAQTRESLQNSISLDQDIVQSKIALGASYVVRFKTPKESVDIEVQDQIRGTITINTNTLDDKVLYKSDGTPTYHLANIVDDHLMQITDVIRGEEWLPSLPLHVLLYEALDFKVPNFAHLPLILKPNGKGKLSKRDGEKGGFPVFPLNWETSEGTLRGYREEGYLASATINMLALLGWHGSDEKELYTLDELCDAFSLDKVNKSGAKFDVEKTKWFQQQHLQLKDNQYFMSIIDQGYPNHKFTDQQLINIVDNLKERAIFQQDIVELSAYLFTSPTQYNDVNLKKCWKEHTASILGALVVLLEQNSEVTDVKSLIKDWITDQKIGMGKVMMPLRLSLVGSLSGIDVFDIISIIGIEETKKRILTLINYQKATV